MNEEQTKETYDGNVARVKLGSELITHLWNAETEVLKAVSAELAYASNETVRVDDLRKLVSQIEDLHERVNDLMMEARMRLAESKKVEA